MDRREVIKFGIGCSLTAGMALVMPARAAGPVHRQPDAAAPPAVINAGVGGNNTADLLARIDRDCLAHQPDLTILMVGTNDLNSVKHIPLPQFEQNLATLLGKLKKSGSRVLLLNVLPAYEPHVLTRHPASFYQPEGMDKRRAAMNDVIGKLAQRFRVHFLDVCSRFEKIGKLGTDRDSLIQNELNSGKTDGIHPTANGHRFLALSVYDYLQFNRLAARKIVCFGDSITKGDGSVDKNSYPAYLKQLLS